MKNHTAASHNTSGIIRKTVIAVLLTAMFIAAAACSAGNPPEDTAHAHVYSAWNTALEASCHTPGTQTRTCFICGKAESRATDRLPHTAVADPAVSPTCTAEGLTAGSHCSVCGEIIEAQQPVPAAHTPVYVVAVEPTCGTPGLTSGSYCAVCAEILSSSESIPATGKHTEAGDAAVAPTCTSTGLTAGSHCSVCGEILVPQMTIAAIPHVPVADAAVAASCKSTGLTAGSHCSVCGTVLTEQKTVAKTAHRKVTDPAVAATYTSAGLSAGSHCSVCGTVTAEQTIKPVLVYKPSAAVGKPVIGIVYSISGTSQSSLDNYTYAVRTAGGTPLLIPCTGGASAAAKWIGRFDALIFSGGEDINPKYYGETITSSTVKINSERDEFELALLELVKDSGCPILGICRGEQLINVYWGGTLNQNIKTHYQTSPGNVTTHAVTLTAGSMLAAMTGNTGAASVMVNTFHHQSVKAVAPGFVITASTAGKVAEAIEPADKSGRFILGVQWHPEMLYRVDIVSRNIFTLYMNAVLRDMERRAG